MRAQVFRGHRGALDVPSGAPLAPRARPPPAVFALALPEGEVERISLRLRNLDALAGTQIVDVSMRELQVAREAPYGEADVPPLRGVGDVRVPLRDELFDERDDLGDVSRDARLVRGIRAADRAKLGVTGVAHPGRERQRLLVALTSTREDLVVDVRDVADDRDLEAARTEVPREDVGHGVGARVAGVREVVRRDPADVDARLAWNHRFESLEPLRERVVEADGHDRGGIASQARNVTLGHALWRARAPPVDEIGVVRRA